MTHPTGPTPTAGKIRVRKDDNRWQVTFPIPAWRKRLTRSVR